MADKKEPFVGQADRPEVRLKADARLSDLTVRDLASLLGQVGGTNKDFWDGKDWQKDDFDGGNKPWKEGKEFKDGKEIKDKDTKEIKDGKEKREKIEKPEIKEAKAEKLESDGVFDPVARTDPRFDQVIQALSGLTARVTALTDQVEAMKKSGDG